MLFREPGAFAPSAFSLGVLSPGSSAFLSDCFFFSSSSFRYLSKSNSTGSLVLLSANTAHVKLSRLYCLWTFSSSLVSWVNWFWIATNSEFSVLNSFSNSALTATSLANFSLFCSNWNLAIRNCLTLAFASSSSFVAASTLAV